MQNKLYANIMKTSIYTDFRYFSLFSFHGNIFSKCTRGNNLPRNNTFQLMFFSSIQLENGTPLKLPVYLIMQNKNKTTTYECERPHQQVNELTKNKPVRYSHVFVLCLLVGWCRQSLVGYYIFAITLTGYLPDISQSKDR